MTTSPAPVRVCFAHRASAWRATYLHVRGALVASVVLSSTDAQGVELSVRIGRRTARLRVSPLGRRVFPKLGVVGTLRYRAVTRFAAWIDRRYR